MRRSAKLTLLILAAALCAAQPRSAASEFKGAIRGRLFDDSGRPFARWKVIAGRWQYHAGRKEFDLILNAEATTRADGTFTIANLDPGDYSIRAENPLRVTLDLNLRLPAIPGPQPTRPGEDFVTTYYPGVTDVTAASTIEVVAGAPSASLDFRVIRTRLFHIRGRVAGPAAGFLSIQPQPYLVPGDARPLMGQRGSALDIDRLLPGTYVINGLFQNFAARSVFTITDHDLDDVIIGMPPCPKVRGTLKLDGRPTNPELALSVLGHAVSYGMGGNNDGTFGVDCVPPDIYSPSLTLHSGWYVTSTRVDGHEIGRDGMNPPLDLTSFAGKTLDIEVSSKAAALRGVVRDNTGAALPGATVTAWNPRTQFNASAVSDLKGAFVITHLPPGDYRIAAWDQLHSQPDTWGVQTVREFRDNFESLAASVFLSESQTQSIDPPLISAAEIRAAARKLHLNAPMMPKAQEAAISEAVKSPQTLAKFLETHQPVDEPSLAQALHISADELDFPRCDLVVSNACKVSIETASNPDLALVIVHQDLPGGEIYFRFSERQPGGWQFVGAFGTAGHYGAPEHEMTRIWNKPFLITKTDRSQNGVGTGQHFEEWLDLTASKFEPVFSFTREGNSMAIGPVIARHIRTQIAPEVVNGVERIKENVDLDFNGPGFTVPYRVTAFFSRRAASAEFIFESASIMANGSKPLSKKEFEQLVDPFDNPPDSKVFAYALAGLRKVATSSNSDDKEWLGFVLEEMEDSPEKRELLRLLKKR